MCKILRCFVTKLIYVAISEILGVILMAYGPFFSFFFCIIKKVFFEGPKKICFGSKFVLFISFCFPVQYCFFRGSAKKTNFGGMSFFFFWQSNFFLERLKKKLGGGGGQFFSNIIKKKNLYISVIFFGGQKKKFEWIKKNLLYGSLPHIN